MLSKFKIARKECVETESWLKLLFSSDAIDEDIKLYAQKSELKLVEESETDFANIFVFSK